MMGQSQAQKVGTDIPRSYIPIVGQCTVTNVLSKPTFQAKVTSPFKDINTINTTFETILMSVYREVSLIYIQK